MEYIKVISFTITKKKVLLILYFSLIFNNQYDVISSKFSIKNYKLSKDCYLLFNTIKNIL